jgi:hypothetical protein
MLLSPTLGTRRRQHVVYLKFRVSTINGMEPEVALVAAGFGVNAMPIHVAVNTVTPLYNAALFTECGQNDPCSRDLLLVRC